MNSVQIAEKDYLGTRVAAVCLAQSPPNSIYRRKIAADTPAGTAKMPLNPSLGKKIRRLSSSLQSLG